MKPKHLLLAPPVVWAAIGLVVLVDGRRALDYFPYFWVANDMAIAAAFAGVMLMLFRGAPAERPPVDEWTDWKPLPEYSLPLEQLLVVLAERLEREALRGASAALTSASRP